MKIISSLENLSFTPRPIYKGKNENEAINLRLKGNEEFKKKEFKKALQLYSGSVMIADHFSEQVQLRPRAFIYSIHAKLGLMCFLFTEIIWKKSISLYIHFRKSPPPWLFHMETGLLAC